MQIRNYRTLIRYTIFESSVFHMTSVRKGSCHYQAQEWLPCRTYTPPSFTLLLLENVIHILYVCVCVCVCVCVHVRQCRRFKRRGFDCSSLVWEDLLEEGTATTPVFLPGESHRQRSLVGYSPSQTETHQNPSNSNSL